MPLYMFQFAYTSEFVVGRPNQEPAKPHRERWCRDEAAGGKFIGGWLWMVSTTRC